MYWKDYAQEHWEDYVQETEAYIRKLERENAELRAQAAERVTLLMKGEALREKMLFQAIMGGAYDKKR